MLTINDMITYNLDIQQFAQDVITYCADEKLLRHLFNAVQHVTVLDPTCGSGAFLFAALKVLVPIYDGCLNRIEALLQQEADTSEPGKLRRTKHGYPLLPAKRLEDFSTILERVACHPNQDYFIYKSIILQNLYGVDIMREAVEIAKLRLFLKLVSTVDPDPKQENYGIEPLPDIDFNIRSGNTLVGFSTEAEIDALFGNEIRFTEVEDERNAIKTESDVVWKVFKAFRDSQTKDGFVEGAIAEAKHELEERLSALKDKLDRFLAKQYGVADNGINEKRVTLARGCEHLGKPTRRDNEGNVIEWEVNKFDYWKASHMPFHWFAEFYGIVHQRGGFDVIIGNPPYVEYTPQFRSSIYTVRGYTTSTCGDLYALVTERCLQIRAKGSGVGLIVPISIFCTDGFDALQKLCWDEIGLRWITTYSNRPAQVFEGAQKRVTILIGRESEKAARKGTWTSSYYRWRSDEREALMKTKVTYVDRPKHNNFHPTSTEKLGGPLEISAFEKITVKSEPLAIAVRSGSDYPIYYTRKFSYFLLFLDRVPGATRLDTNKAVTPSELKALYFSNEEAQYAVIAALSSSIFFWFWNVLSDCRNLNRRDVLAFPLNPDSLPPNVRKSMAEWGKKYIEVLEEGSHQMTKSGLSLESFDIPLCKPILDEIDGLLGTYYGLNGEELDHIINYDIKYRIKYRKGDEMEGSDDEDPPSAKKAPKAKPPKAAAAAQSAKRAKGKSASAEATAEDPDPFG